MATKTRLHLFEAFGVELEYMIVKDDSLNVTPLAEVLLRGAEGMIQGEIEHGDIAWSNELVSHVIELKSNGPKADLMALSNAFHENVVCINEQLGTQGARLLPTAAHPWMNPSKETTLWPHESGEIYEVYDRIFNCKGHGWSNLQSTHINLPFYDDEEFSKLHTAIRFIMPLIPALTASSPILNGKYTGYQDRRLYYYELNQARIPAITGKVIPERIFTKHGYQKRVYDKIASAIEPYNSGGLLDPIWLNSRGAIARFDRGAIEIRVIDIQECPKGDLAIVALVVAVLKILVAGKWISFDVQQAHGTSELYHVFKECVKNGSDAIISDPEYLKALGYTNHQKAHTVWLDLIDRTMEAYPSWMQPWSDVLRSIVNHGTLAERIIKSLNGDFSREELHAVYKKLSGCLQTNSLFVP
ncbi:glutamate-cysteine ligase family protein [Marinoscillum sp. MHG1-6]|uniref:carboxylate-amine ligase n=1 Tax=Marinoscillum sp. MHG1-6 TaxID=2959627 RepID=UPI00215800B4|nr:glutamate-cysteine ligase family protein [Marinoscillum sp. MHG1-6]